MMVAILLLMFILVISITNSTTTDCGPYTNGGSSTTPNTCTCTFSGTGSCSYTLYGVVQASATGITIYYSSN